MEASEKPQLPLDPGPSDPGGAEGDGTVRAIGDRLVIERLTVDDERAARVVQERAKADRPPVETVRKAIEIGARVLDSEETAANVDYVRAEFERHAAALRERLMKSLETGDQQLTERIAETFDGSREESVQKEIDRLLSRALEEQRTALLRLFSAEEGANPLHDFKGAMVRAFKALDSRQQNEGEENRRRIEALTREVVELKKEREADELVMEAEEAGTRKGRTFEERVHSALDEMSTARGDVAHHTGGELSEGGGKKGDSLIEIGAVSGPCCGRIVFEAKDKRLSKQDAWRELNGSMAERGAEYAVLVVAGEEKVPRGREQLYEYEGNKLIVAVDREEPAGIALETAYRLAVARVLMSRSRELTVDAAGVRDEADAAVAALKEAQRIRSALSGAEKSIGNARSGLDGMVESVRVHLERIDALVADAEPDSEPDTEAG
jgi:Uncharacterized protein conserved in bacteria (DUF2130)